MSFYATAVAVQGAPGKPCEDSAAAHPTGAMIVVADGLGSTGRGAQASQLAVRWVMERARPSAQLGLDAALIAQRVAQDFNAAVRGDRRVATTCLYFWTNSMWGSLARIGDGLALVRLTSGEVIHASEARAAAFANETEALPRGQFNVRSWPIDQIDAVLLATDGVADDLKPHTYAEMITGFSDLLRTRGPIETKNQLREWLTHWPTQNSNDDRSVALLARHI